jgi:signal-transduction protein with cAMP-binding, CBS, and nucleotidyltransferase domain
MSTSFVSVRQVMTTHPMLVDGMATVAEAVSLMHQHNVSSLIINRRYDGDEYGILVVTDIAQRLIALDKSATRTNVYEIMTKPVLTVEAGMDSKYAIRMLQQFSLSRALVLDHGELCGIVTLRDLVFRFLLPASAFE